MRSWAKIRESALSGIILLFALLAMTGAAQAQFYSEPKPLAPVGKPAGIENVGIDQHLNQQLPLDLPFRDESGNQVQLRQYFGNKPVILTFVYYTCPMLCSEVQSGLTSALGVLKFTVGKDFDVVSVSINPKETPQDAMANRRTFLQRYHRQGAANGWHFLTGDESSIEPLTKAAGFRYTYDRESGQYYHATAVMVVTPEGKLAQYFYGIEYPPNDLRLALVQASQNKIGNLADVLLLYCFHYDPKTGRYSATVLNIVRLGGLLTFCLLGGFMALSLRREAHQRANDGPGPRGRT
jgi:protein SCO1